MHVSQPVASLYSIEYKYNEKLSRYRWPCAQLCFLELLRCLTLVVRYNITSIHRNYKIPSIVARYSNNRACALQLYMVPAAQYGSFGHCPMGRSDQGDALSRTGSNLHWSLRIGST